MKWSPVFALIGLVVAAVGAGVEFGPGYALMVLGGGMWIGELFESRRAR